jgi:hypothetical protein
MRHKANVIVIDNTSVLRKIVVLKSFLNIKMETKIIEIILFITIIKSSKFLILIKLSFFIIFII